ncbi:MAG TPA: hypothetical protein VKE22_21110 [Haliangiales bacterium]|nr:hypothetical protein [Haliangiales bacterium]
MAEIFFHPKGRSPAPMMSLADCRREVTGLLHRLADAAAGLQLDAVKGQAGDLPARWDAFAAGWQTDWEATGERCGFRQNMDTGLGQAYDRLARVHENLATTRLKYAALLSRFAKDVLPDVSDMRGALDKVSPHE